MNELATLRRQTRAALCLSCGKCSTMCPLASSNWFSATRLVALRQGASGVAEGEAQQSRQRAVDACLTCGACEVRCPEGVHFSDFVRGLRTLATANGRWPCPHGQLLQSAARHMAAGDAPRRSLGWLDDDLEVAEEGSLALFVGCLELYDVLFGRELGIATLDIARSAIRLLNRLGIQPVLLDGERCCGHDLLWNGEAEAFHDLAQANLTAFEARGVEHILTTCGECCRTWRIDYAATQTSYRPRVEHLAEFLAARLEDGKLASVTRSGSRLTYQDPCRLGRHLDVLEEPRQVLREIANGKGVVEMDRSGRDAACCGTAGFIHCDANSRRLQSERLAEAAATGADMLVTACPKCLIHFRCAQAEDRRRGRPAKSLEVEDLTVLAASSLGASAEPQPDPSARRTGGAR